MNRAAQHGLQTLGVVFALYLAVRGFVWPGETISHPLGVIAVAVVVAAVTLLTVFVSGPAPRHTGEPSPEVVALLPGGGGPTASPWWLTGLALVVAAASPTVVALSFAPEARTAPAATAYIGAVGALMAVLMVRRRSWAAWAGTALLSVGSMVWLGPGGALTLGLVGSITWVAIAQLMMVSIDRAVRDTVRLAQVQEQATARRAAAAGRRRERREQVRRAIAVAGPVLARTIDGAGVLSAADRVEARVAEGTLRDELRGRRLLDDAVREQLFAARRRGAVVTVIDDGGLDDLDADGLRAVRGRLVEVLASARSPRLYVRSSPDDRVAVTVAGLSSATPGGDDVQLWVEIPRPTVA